MAGRTRLISVPPARGGDDRRGYRQLSGSMGATMAPDPSAPGTGTMVPTGPVPFQERFEAAVVPDDDWSRTIAMREQAEGLPAPRMQPTQSLRSLGEGYTTALPIVAQQTVNLEGLPERFTLEVESKPDGWWKVSAPAHHAGLFIAHQDLIVALTDAPGALAQILRLDGPVPAKPKRRRS
jgi:hypothetical protein